MVVNRELVKKLKNEDFAKTNNLPHITMRMYKDGWGYVQVRTHTVNKKIMDKVWQNKDVLKNIKFYRRSISLKNKKDTHYGCHIDKESIYVDCRKGEEYEFAMDILDIYFKHIEFYKKRMKS